MIGLKVPKFEMGSILSREMLESLKDLSAGWAKVEYQGYADGILSGCQVTMSDNMLYVHEGMLIVKGELYFIQEKISLPYEWHEGWQVLKAEAEQRQEKNFREGSLRIFLTENTEEQENTIELCRFYLQRGASLRNQHRDFNDMDTNYDTVNEIHAKWAAFQQSSVSIRLLKEFAKAAEKSSNMQDMLMVQQIKNAGGKTISREVLIYYLNTRLQKQNMKYSNYEIYQGLQEILREMKFGTTERKRETGNRRMIID